jgi:PAS domain S-box-containing protein
MRPAEPNGEVAMPDGDRFDYDEALRILIQLGAAVDQAAVKRSTEHLRVDDNPQVAEARYRALVEQIPAVTFRASLDGGLDQIYVSPQIERLLGFTQEEWMSSPVRWFDQLHPDDRELWNEEFARGCRTGGPFRAECRFIARDGSVVWVHGEARLIRDEHGRPVLLQGVAFDITESKRAEQIVRASLREKELLLKEIHHRVKNNLQITSSLLRLQVAKIPDEQVRDMIHESQDRIQSMALVHELLYRSTDLAHVDFGDYVRGLVDQLLRSYGATARRIGVNVEVGSMQFAVDEAIPCGLIINELVSNSLKHAFPGGRTGTIRIRGEGDATRATICVSDDGAGLPAGDGGRKRGTLGLQLVRTLTDQLEGSIEVRSGNGTEFTIAFPRRRATS